MFQMGAFDSQHQNCLLGRRRAGLPYPALPRSFPQRAGHLLEQPER